MYIERERKKGKNEERDSDFVRQHPRAWRTGMVIVHFGNAGVRVRVPRVDKQVAVTTSTRARGVQARFGTALLSSAWQILNRGGPPIFGG